MDGEYAFVQRSFNEIAEPDGGAGNWGATTGRVA